MILAMAENTQAYNNTHFNNIIMYGECAGNFLNVLEFQAKCKHVQEE